MAIEAGLLICKLASDFVKQGRKLSLAMFQKLCKSDMSSESNRKYWREARLMFNLDMMQPWFIPDKIQKLELFQKKLQDGETNPVI